MAVTTYYAKGQWKVCLRKMLPSNSIDDGPNGGYGHQILCGQYLARLRACSNRVNIGIGQFGTSMIAAFHLMNPAGTIFRNSVSNILNVRAEKQMVQLNAARRVATMQDAQAVRNRAVSDHPCHAMCIAFLAKVAKMRIIIRVGRNRADSASVRGEEITAPHQRLMRSFLRLHDASTEVSWPVSSLWQRRGATLFPVLSF